MDTGNNPYKQVIARSRAVYRGFEIYETITGCKVIIGATMCRCDTLDEARAMIDSVYDRMIADMDELKSDSPRE